MSLAETIQPELWYAEPDSHGRGGEASQSLAATMARSTGLKPFPEAAREVMTLLDHGGFKFTDLVDVVESDPGLASRVVQVANSPVYAPPRPIECIRHAVILIGAHTLREVVVVAAFNGMFEDSAGVGRAIVHHSVGVAGILRVMEGRRRVDHQTFLYLCGLLHDVGKLLLIQAEELAYGTLELEVLTHPDAVHATERRVLGFDHAVLGAHVVQDWGLPSPIPEVIATHHDPTRAFNRGRAVGHGVACLRVADALEYEVGRRRSLDDALVEQLIGTPSGTYLQLTAEELVAVWDEVTRSASSAGRTAQGEPNRSW